MKMNCPDCQSEDIFERSGLTELSYIRYEFRSCYRRFNERPGTPFNFIAYPTEIVLLMIFHVIRYRLRYENVAEIFWLRDFRICSETIRLWVFRFGVYLGKLFRRRRKGKAGGSWYVDETYLKVGGDWCYLYRARDKKGELIDCYLSATRNKESAIAFFKQSIAVVGHKPKTITTDNNPAYIGALDEVFKNAVNHRTNKYLNNLEEQDHRDFKSVYRAMKGFKDFLCALIFYTILEKLQNFLQPLRNKSHHINSTDKRGILVSKFNEITKMATAN